MLRARGGFQSSRAPLSSFELDCPLNSISVTQRGGRACPSARRARSTALIPSAFHRGILFARLAHAAPLRSERGESANSYWLRAGLPVPSSDADDPDAQG